MSGVRALSMELFFAAALVAVVTVGVAASRSAKAEDDGGALPADIASFGFALRGRLPNDVAILEASRPFEASLANGPLAGRPPGAGRARDVIARELSRYPGSFARRIRLRGVVLASELTESGQPIPSLPNVGGLLFVDVGAAEADLVRALHHEVFHFADLADDGTLGSDPEWAALNVPGTHYGSGGRTMRGAWAARSSPELAGFVSAYATSGVEEDKAETFSFAVARAGEAEARARVDEALARKLHAVTVRVARLDADTPKALGLVR